MNPRLYRLQVLAGVGLSAGVWTGIDGLWGQGHAIAQITPDASFGSQVNGSAVNSCLSATCTITGGTLNNAESALLHSFKEFSLNQPLLSQTALFVDPGVHDIIVRTTGGAASIINGALQTSAGSTANLFFINPSGISFGPAAHLDLGGAFVASTASRILFENGIELTAGETTPVTPQLLTVSAPLGLGLTASSAPITAMGTGNRLVFGSPNNPNAQFVNRFFQQLPAEQLPPISELAVRPGEAIALIGNGVELTGGNITALGGQVSVGSIADGTALFNSDLTLSYEGVNRFADVALTERSTIEASASQAGKVWLQGKDIFIQDSSAVLAETLPAIDVLKMDFPDVLSAASGGASGLIDIRATGTVEVSGFTAEPTIPFNPPFYSYLSVDVAPEATGAGGTIDLYARNLSVDQGGQLGANTFGKGDAGRLNIAVDETAFLGEESILGPSGLFATTDEASSGRGGQITIKAGHFSMSQGAQVLTSSLNQGAAGSIVINADRVSLNGTSIPIDVPFADGGLQTVVSPTLIQSTMGESSQGQGGDITLRAGALSVTGGAEIATGTFGEGSAGAIDITAQDAEVSGFTARSGPSAILTTVNSGASGSGGDLTIETERLRVVDGGQIATGTRGAGQAGDLRVTSDLILVSGETSAGRSGLFATAIEGTGAGGNLAVAADVVRVEAGATLSVSNFPSVLNSPVLPGKGGAGDLAVTAQSIAVSDRGQLTAETAEGDRGSITLTTNLLTLRKNSRITTNATESATGGNINIDASNGFILAVPNENSDITANAVFGKGGRVDIAAQQVLGITSQLALTNDSDITASSEFGVAGTTQLETPDTVLRNPVDARTQSTEVPTLVQGCGVGGNQRDSTGRFVQSGRGGIGTGPYGVLNSRDSLADVSLPSALAGQPLADTNAATNEPAVEAQGWQMNDQGTVTLLAAAPEREGERCLGWRS